jgi:hypothetical protein
MTGKLSVFGETSVVLSVSERGQALSLGGIDTRTWSSRLAVGGKADDLAL